MPGCAPSSTFRAEPRPLCLAAPSTSRILRLLALSHGPRAWLRHPRVMRCAWICRLRYSCSPSTEMPIVALLVLSEHRDVTCRAHRAPPARAWSTTCPKRGPCRCIPDSASPLAKRGRVSPGSGVNQAGAVCGGLTQACRGWCSCARLELMDVHWTARAERAGPCGAGALPQAEGR